MDLAAEKLLIAEKGTQKIAVEIKTFGGDSEVADLEQAIGQYFTYLAIAILNETQHNSTFILNEVLYQSPRI